MKSSVMIGLLSLLWACEVSAVAYTNSFPLKSTPGVYKGINWVNVTATQYNTEIYDACVAPASGKTYGALLNGSDPSTPTQGNPGVMTAQYAGSKTKSFALSSFYGACATPEQTDVDGTVSPIFVVAANCTLVVSGYKTANGNFPPAGAKPAVIKRFKYISNDGCPNGGAPMTKYTLPSTWTGLRLVTFKYISTAKSTPPNASGNGNIYYTDSTVAFLDDVVYTTQT